MLETEKLLLRKGLWYPSRGWSQILLRPAAEGFGTQGESSKRLGQCFCFCFLQHIQQNGPLGRPKEGLVHRNRVVSFLSLSTSWEFASEWLLEAVCLIFWWPFWGSNGVVGWELGEDRNRGLVGMGEKSKVVWRAEGCVGVFMVRLGKRERNKVMWGCGGKWQTLGCFWGLCELNDTLGANPLG